MTIKLTAEMAEAYSRARLDALGVRRDDTEGAIRHGLRAVLAIVERDLPDVDALVRGAYARGQSDERALTRLLGPPVSVNDDREEAASETASQLQETYPGSGIYE
jgi:hypothetical protein